jgi:glycosyltransferase involved in cell wall biosynthesis
MAPQVIFDYFHQSPDVVHCHGYRNALKDIFYLGNLVDSKPLVIHGHGTFLGGEHDPTTERSYQYELYDRVWSRTLDRADAVVVSSKQEFNEGIEFGINKNKLWTIPVGKEPDTFTSIPRNPPDDYFRILFVGRLAPRRNLEMLISSVAELKSYDIELRIVGGEGAVSNSSRSNYVDELKQLVAEENLEDMVTLTGPKYGRELISEYRSADVFANPTHYENFGQANLEAAFSGLPLLSTPTGVALDLIDEDETGYFFETTAGLSDILSSIISDKEQVNSMSENILLKARSGYSWEPIIDQYLELYEHVMS